MVAQSAKKSPNLVTLGLIEIELTKQRGRKSVARWWRRRRWWWHSRDLIGRHRLHWRHGNASTLDVTTITR